jgi:tetratricopeptide (TPR) repeat protein
VDASLRQHYERFAADRDAVEAFEVLEIHLAEREAWLDLASLYRRRLEAASLAGEPEARARVHLRLGMTLEDRLSDDEAALCAYQEAARLDPTSRDALQRLRGVYTRRGSYDVVLQVAEHEVASAMPLAERAQLLDEMAQIWEREFGDVQQAAACRARAEDERPTDCDDAPPVRGGEMSEDDDEALVHQAWLASSRGDVDAALASLREALERDSSDLQAIDMMVTVLDGSERHAEAAELLERRAELATDPATRGAVLSRLADVRERQLGDPVGACAAFERAVEADPGNATAVQALRRLYRTTRSWKPLREMLEAGATSGSLEEQVDAIRELAELLEIQFDDSVGARRACERALELSPGEPRICGVLQRLRAAQALGEAPTAVDPGRQPSAATGDPSHGEHRAELVVGVLERKLETLEGSGVGLEPEAVGLRLRIAELRASKLDDPAGAIAVLEAARESDAAMGRIAGRLADLYERAGRYEDLGALARRASGVLEDRTERAEWLRRAAETSRSTGDVEGAIDSYVRLVEERPNDPDARAALLELHRARGDAEPLVTALRAELARADGEGELSMHLEIAGLLEDALADPAGALSHLRRAIELVPGDEGIAQRALGLAEAVGGAFGRLDLIDHAVGLPAPAENRARWLVRRGDLLATEVGWSDEATECWRTALELAPELAEARERLEKSTDCEPTAGDSA